MKRYAVIISFFFLLFYEGVVALFRFFKPLTIEEQSDYIKARFDSFISMMRLSVLVQGEENIGALKGRNVVIISNHRSMVDIHALYKALPASLNVRMVAKKELFKIPFFGRILKTYHFISIDRSCQKNAISSLKRSLDLLKKGVSVLFFPEGTRSRGSALLPFKKGAFRMAISADAMILPIAIRGSDQVTPKRKLTSLQLGRSVEVVIGRPVDAAVYDEKSVGELIEVLQAKISAMLEKSNS